MGANEKAQGVECWQRGERTLAICRKERAGGFSVVHRRRKRPPPCRRPPSLLPCAPRPKKGPPRENEDDALVPSCACARHLVMIARGLFMSSLPTPGEGTWTRGGTQDTRSLKKKQKGKVS